MRKEYCVGASIGALALKLADTPTRRRIYFYLSAVTRCFASGASIAQGRPLPTAVASYAITPPKSAAVALARSWHKSPTSRAEALTHFPFLCGKKREAKRNENKSTISFKKEVNDWEECKQKRLRFG